MQQLFAHDSELAMGAIAQWSPAAFFAATKHRGLGGRGDPLFRRHAVIFMGTITKRLFLTATAGAPKIGLAFFDIDHIGPFFGNN